ncbi:hypothetical protein K2173_011034 [Erythroxylum novogranatense]|uniref:VQ domain-containing protein n=1 Tax=Erythroxylum novogranatense TaxID=1862640 RepID=A0AAV8T1T8_9ROSI|nr:hypothetical protein K2173_011034 [Erythroxylum novogranatense]
MDSSKKDLVQDRKKPGSMSKSKKKPMKVVYISNPMKFKTSASGFRALVQELTGQDAEYPDARKTVDCEDVGGHGGQVVHDASKSCSSTTTTVVDDLPSEVSGTDLPRDQVETPDDCPFDPYDGVFIPQMFEIFPGLVPSSLLLESDTHGFARNRVGFL